MGFQLCCHSTISATGLADTQSWSAAVLPCYISLAAHCCCVTSLPCQSVVVSRCCNATLLLCHIFAMSNCCCVTLLQCHTCSYTLLLCHIVAMSHCCRVAALRCHSAALLQCPKDPQQCQSRHTLKVSRVGAQLHCSINQLHATLISNDVQRLQKLLHTKLRTFSSKS